MRELIDTVGPYAGLLSFVGLAVLALMFFIQSRDVRRLRDWAGGAPERDSVLTEATSDLAEQRAEELKRIEDERRSREEAHTAEADAAKLRERRRIRREKGLPEETRWERLRSSVAAPSGTRERPTGTSLALIIAAVVLLGAGVTIGALQIFGGDDDGGGTAAESSALSPANVEVAVLNGTDTQGLAGTFDTRLTGFGYEVGAVTNSRSTFEDSVVMFESGFRPEAEMVATRLDIQSIRPANAEIKSLAAGARVTVVVGEDKSSGAPS